MSLYICEEEYGSLGNFWPSSDLCSAGHELHISRTQKTYLWSAPEVDWPGLLYQKMYFFRPGSALTPLRYEEPWPCTIALQFSVLRINFTKIVAADGHKNLTPLAFL
jgi:hypothetical protein